MNSSGAVLDTTSGLQIGPLGEWSSLHYHEPASASEAPSPVHISTSSEMQTFELNHTFSCTSAPGAHIYKDQHAVPAHEVEGRMEISFLTSDSDATSGASSPARSPLTTAGATPMPSAVDRQGIPPSIPAHIVSSLTDKCNEAMGVCTPPAAAASPTASPAKFQEHERDGFNTFHVPALLLGRSTDQAECFLAYEPNLSSGEPSLQYKFAVHANFRRRCHPSGRATCRLCGQHGAVLACDLSVLIEGHADLRPLAAGTAAHVRVFYGIASAGLGITCLNLLGHASFSSPAGPVFRMWIPENELKASRNAGILI